MVECCAQCLCGCYRCLWDDCCAQWWNVVLNVCVDVIDVCGIEVVLSGGMLCSMFVWML